MRIIEYEANRGGTCSTPCPYIKRTSGESQIMVGSHACCICSYCKSRDLVSKVVECLYYKDCYLPEELFTL
jgi:hypothetical protein